MASAELQDFAVVPDPGWRVEPVERGVVLHAGADRVHELPGLSAEEIGLVVRWFGGGAVDRDAHPRAGALADVLLQAGALRVAAPRDALPVALRFAGDPSPGLVSAVASALGDQLVDDAPAGITVLVRTNATWAATFDVAGSLMRDGRAHLLCDLAYYDRVGIGPLVVPGQTACVECFGGRIAKRWGDVPVPSAPQAVAAGSLVVAGAVAHVLSGLRAGDPLPYVTACSVVELATMAATRGSVVRSPWCTRCEDVPTTARVHLPW